MNTYATDAPVTRSDWGGVAFGLAVSSFAAFQLLKLPPALPLMIDAYGYDRITAGGLVSIYAFSGLLLSVLAGGQIARSPSTVMSVSLLLFAIGNLVTLVVPGTAWLNLLARGLEGLAYAVFAIAGPAIANRSASPDQLPFVAGIVAIWVPIGQVLALVGGFLFFENHGWQYLWWMSIALTVGMTVWALFRWNTIRTTLSVEAQHATRDVPDRRFQLVLAGVVFALWSGQYIAFMTWLPNYMTVEFAIGADLAAAINLIAVVGVLVSCLAAGLLLRHGAPFGLLFVTTTVIQVAVWLLAPYPDAVTAVAALTVYGIVSGAAPTCLFAVPGLLFSHNQVSSTAFGYLMTGRNLGILAAPIAAGWIIDDFGWMSFGLSFGLVTLASTVGGLVLAVAIARSVRR